MIDIPKVKFYSLSSIKDRLLYETLKNIKNGIDISYVTQNLQKLYSLYWKQGAALIIAQKECDRLKYSERDKSELIETLRLSIENLTIFPAAYSWLVTEEQDNLANLDNHGLDINLATKQIKYLPDDIPYGLVLKHFTPVYRATQYLAGFSKDEEHTLFIEPELKAIRSSVRNNVKLNIKNYTEEDFDKVASEHDPMLVYEYML